MKTNNPLETNVEFLRNLIAFAYEHGYHEHGYDVLEETLSQLRPSMIGPNRLRHVHVQMLNDGDGHYTKVDKYADGGEYYYVDDVDKIIAERDRTIEMLTAQSAARLQEIQRLREIPRLTRSADNVAALDVRPAIAGVESLDDVRKYLHLDPDAAAGMEVWKIGGMQFVALDVVQKLHGCPQKAPELDGCHGLDTSDRVRFYEHDFYVLSNFSAFMVQYKGIMFPTAEHAYQWSKFPDDPLKQAAIRTASSAHDAFKMAERWAKYRRPDWQDAKVGIMNDILLAKVEQHEYVKRKLLATGDRQLVEDSWRDDFWGWGPNRDGENMLGKLWMAIRRKLNAKETRMAHECRCHSDIQEPNPRCPIQGRSS